MRIDDPRVTGLSGITFAGDDRYFGILEWQAQIVGFDIKLDADGTITSAAIREFISLPKDRRDLEGIALADEKSVFVSSDEATLFQADLRSGKIIRDLPVPKLMKDIVRGYGFESVTLSSDRNTLWTANERALKCDGNTGALAVPMSAITRLRLLRYDRRGDEFVPTAQYEYDTSGVHDFGGTIGLCDLAALPDGRPLALERSAAQSIHGKVAIRTRIFLADPRSATDISQPPFDQGLVNRDPPAKVKKTLLFDGFVCDEDGENVEGLCVGPRLASSRTDVARYALLAVVDNTDGGLGVSKTSIVSFVLSLPSGEAK